ncbi:MAG: GNAT family N-acetyltransferase [Actinomycetes bacterium]
MIRLRTERLELSTLTIDEASAISLGDRSGRIWADDYPTPGDLIVAGIALHAGEHYDEDAALGVLQMRLLPSEPDPGPALVIGGIGFINPPDADGFAEVGYGIAESYQGQGFATEALLVVIDYARTQGALGVIAVTEIDNLPSQRLAQRCGLVFVGRFDSGDDRDLQRWELRFD